jgi:hypothetical protein
MTRKTGDNLAVVHAPAVLALEVLTDAPPGEGGGGRRHPLVSGGVAIVVVHAEEERVSGLPRKPQRTRGEDRRFHAESIASLVVPSPSRFSGRLC